jgi:hypothetical protein
MLTTLAALELRIIPVNKPDAGSIEALSGKLLLHVPPAGELVRVAVSVGHNATGTITDGNGLTVTGSVTKHAALAVDLYVMTALPTLTPVAHPLAAIVATDVLLLLHIPPLLTR